jgi:hypothetical protein
MEQLTVNNEEGGSAFIQRCKNFEVYDKFFFTAPPRSIVLITLRAIPVYSAAPTR